MFPFFLLTAPNVPPPVQKPPLVVFVAGDHEYSGEETLPQLAAALEKHFGLRTKVLKAFPNQNSEENIPGLEALKDADVAVFFLRWRRLPKEQVDHIDEYFKSGKPVVGFRTSTHAFNYPKGHPLEEWNRIASKAFGGPPGWGAEGHTHYGHESTTEVHVNPDQKSNPILKGVQDTFFVRSWLYKVVPNYPPPGAVRLLIGKSIHPDNEAVESPVAWTWKNDWGGKVFFTTMGHPEDFWVESFQRLVVNGIHWALGKPSPDKWPTKLPISAVYRGIKQ
jgi:type 1 glutamine amidotransferase